MATSKL
jgi:hypothetical protein